jgi:hypothetical protein
MIVAMVATVGHHNKVPDDESSLIIMALMIKTLSSSSSSLSWTVRWVLVASDEVVVG